MNKIALKHGFLVQVDKLRIYVRNLSAFGSEIGGQRAGRLYAFNFEFFCNKHC